MIDKPPMMTSLLLAMTGAPMHAIPSFFFKQKTAYEIKECDWSSDGVLFRSVLRPAVVDFIELATRQEHVDLQLEEMQIAGSSPLAGSNLRDSGIRADLKVIIVAVKKPNGKMLFNPDPELTLERGDVLVAIGPREQ